jgi:hypothetical protein
MKWLLAVVVCAALALATWRLTERPEPPPFQIRTRTVAFDNLYGNVDKLAVQAKVDDGVEQTTTAACDAKTCTLELPLTNGQHELVLSVEQNGLRSASTKVTLDTSNLR